MVAAMVRDDAWARWSVVEDRGVVISAVVSGGHEGGSTREEKGFCLENMMLSGNYCGRGDELTYSNTMTRSLKKITIQHLLMSLINT